MRAVVVFAFTAALAGAAHAQMGMPPTQMPMGDMPMGQAPPAGQVLGPAGGKGEVTRIDEATGRLGIRHEPIPALNMATGMNMLFRLADPAMLTQVKVGDTVTFEAQREGAVVTITKLQKAP